MTIKLSEFYNWIKGILNKKTIIVICYLLLLFGCEEKVTEVKTIYKDIPFEFPSIYLYDENNNQIADTLFVNFNSKGVIEDQNKALYFSIKFVIKYDSTDNFRMIDQLHFDENFSLIPGVFTEWGTEYDYLNMSILSPIDSIVFIENRNITKPLSDSTLITNRTICNFYGYYYSIDSGNIFGKTKSFIIHNLN